MTIIKRLVIKGFKSFASKTEIILGNSFNCFVGPNGSGKCIIGDSLVNLEDGSLVKIGDLVETKIKENPIKNIDDGYVALGDNLKIKCLDLNDLKIKSKKISSYVKRKSPETLLKIKTRSGRVVTSTKYHPLFILKDNKVVPIKAEEINLGTRIAVPRQIENNVKNKIFFELLDLIKVEDNIYIPYENKFVEILKQRKRGTWLNFSKKLGVSYSVLKGALDKQAINFEYFVKILRKLKYNDNRIIGLIRVVKSKGGGKCNMIWENSPEFARFLGYLFSEGRLPPRSTSQIWFPNSCEEMIIDYKYLAENLFGVKVSVNQYVENMYDVLIYSEVLRKLLSKFGMPFGNTEKKDLTNLFLTHSTNLEFSNFFNGLFSGDGYVGDSLISITTKSKKLGFVIENILLRLGISFSSAYRIKVATNSEFSGIYRVINIYGVDNFKKFNENIKLVEPNKQKRLFNLLNKKSNTNTDLIEVNSLVKSVAKEFKLKIKPMKKSQPKLESYVYNSCLPSRNGINQLIQHVFTDQNVKSENLTKLTTLSNSDIFWDEVAEVEEIKSEHMWVYDLCVDDSHNFIANNMIVHNTNVSDAICFVLGRSSAKDMRAEKSANLIYHGGKKNNPASYAEVMIEFDNIKREFPIDSDDVHVSRTVNKNGNSTYRINNDVRTRQQVIDLLNTINVDPDGYNIVLQGDIVSMAEMKPVEKRKLVEQLLGIASYEEKKEKCLNDLEKVDAKLNETQIILAERDRNLKELRKDRDQAKRYKELETQIKEEKATLLHLQLNKKKEDIEDIEKKKKNFENDIEKLNNVISELKAKIDGHNNQILEINTKLDIEGEKNQFVIKKEIEDIKTSIVRSTSRLDVCNSEIKKAGARKEQLKITIEELDSKIKDLENEKKKIVNDSAVLEQSERIIDKKIEEFRIKNNIGSLTTGELEKIESEIEDVSVEINNLKEEQQTLLRTKDQLQFKINNFNENIDNIQGKGKSEEVKKLKQLKDELKRLNDDYGMSGGRIDLLISKINETRQLIYKNDSELSRLKSKQLSIKESSEGDLATRKILEQINEIKGIHGTVAQLGTVDTKYALALEVAAGQRTHSIVVDSDFTAKKCIEYLKQHKLGIVRFLPMNKIVSETVPKSVRDIVNKNKDVYGLAVELVKFDKKYSNVFSYVFGSTLIVNDIDSAREIGVGTARMVTLEGDLFEQSGAIIGGYRVKDISRGFREKQIDDDVERLTEDVVKLKKLINDLEINKIKEEKNNHDLRETRADVSGEIVRIEKSLNIDGKIIDDLIKSKDILNKALKENESEFHGIENKLNVKVEKFESLKGLRHELQEKLANVSLLKDVEKFEEEKLKIKEQRLKVDSNLKSIDMQISSMFFPEKERTIKIIKQHEKEIEDFESEIKELNEVVKKRNAELKIKEKEEAKFFADFKNLIDKRTKFQEIVRKIEEDVIRKEEGVRSVEHRLNDLSIVRAKEIAMLEGMNKEFENYQGFTIKRGMSIEELKGKISIDEREFGKIGNVNLRALEVYEEIEREYNSVVEKLEKLKLEKQDIFNMMAEIDLKKKEIFLKNFKGIAANFRRIFSSLTLKGEEAYLELENPENPFEGGLDIKVRVSGHKFIDLRGMSGGEKTLAALAFIFALQEYQPSPFYLLDEVDAALDKRNSELLVELIQKYSRSAQYLLISHNDALVTGAECIYGVTMQDGISKIVSIKVPA
jgi:chromosome segregation protein